MVLDVAIVRVHALATTAMATAAARAPTVLVIKLEHRHESLLRDLDGAHPLHPLLSFLLLLQQLALARDVTAIAFGQHVFSHRRDRLASHNLASDRGLER